MNELTEFLLARIAEDEAKAQASYPHGPIWEDSEDYDAMAQNEALWRLQVHTSECGYRMGEMNEPCGCSYPARVLAECESKRHLLDEALVWGEGCLDVMARYMAEVYADHPAYDEAWRP